MAMADQGSLPVQSSLTEVCLAERRGHLSLERHECGRREAKWHFFVGSDPIGGTHVDRLGSRHTLVIRSRERAL